MEKKIVVPEGMLKAAAEALFDQTMILNGNTAQVILEAALLWLSENPIVPTMEQATEMSDSGHPCVLDGVWYAIEWQRRMFLAPEPVWPEAVKDLTCTPEQLATLDGVNKEIAIRANNAIAEAYNRGLKGAK